MISENSLKYLENSITIFDKLTDKEKTNNINIKRDEEIDKFNIENNIQMNDT